MSEIDTHMTAAEKKRIENRIQTHSFIYYPLLLFSSLNVRVKERLIRP